MEANSPQDPVCSSKAVQAEDFIQSHGMLNEGAIICANHIQCAKSERETYSVKEHAYLGWNSKLILSERTCFKELAVLGMVKVMKDKEKHTVSEHVKGMFPEEGGHWESSFGLGIPGEQAVWRRPEFCILALFMNATLLQHDVVGCIWILG